MNESVDLAPDSNAVITEPVPDLQLQLLIQLLDREMRSGPPLWRGRLSDVSGWALGRPE